MNVNWIAKSANFARSRPTTAEASEANAPEKTTALSRKGALGGGGQCNVTVQSAEHCHTAMGNLTKFARVPKTTAA